MVMKKIVFSLPIVIALVYCHNQACNGKKSSAKAETKVKVEVGY